MKSKRMMHGKKKKKRSQDCKNYMIHCLIDNSALFNKNSG